MNIEFVRNFVIELIQVPDKVARLLRAAHGHRIERLQGGHQYVDIARLK